MAKKGKNPAYGKGAKAASSARIYWVAGGVVAAVVLVIGLSVGLNRSGGTTPPAPSAPAASADRKAMGPTTAPVTLIEYGDFL